MRLIFLTLLLKSVIFLAGSFSFKKLSGLTLFLRSRAVTNRSYRIRLPEKFVKNGKLNSPIFLAKVIFGFLLFMLVHTFKGYSRTQPFFSKTSFSILLLIIIKEGNLWRIV